MGRKMLKHKLREVVGVSGIVCITISMLAGCAKEQDVVYRETKVEYGSLVVGKTESGAVDIGTVEQVFEMDLSALQRVEISGNNTGAGMSGANMPGGTGGGMDMFSQMLSMAGANTPTTESSNVDLIIEEVCVTVGEQVEAGDVLYILQQDGVNALAEELESNVTKAKADLEAVIADQTLSKTNAEYTYEINVAYGEFAEMERASTITALQDAVNEKTEALAEAKEALSKYKSQLEQAKVDYDKAYAAQKNAEWARDNTNKDDSLYYYTESALDAITTKQLADSLEQEKEQLESKVEQAQENITLCEKQLAQAQRALEEGILSAQETYELRMLAYETAQETYDVTLAYLEDDLKTQQEIYDGASEKWEEFSGHIEGNTIVAQHGGVITSVGLEVGDSLNTGTSVVTLYDAEEVSMTVSLEEEDMTDIAVGSLANISFIAYPDTIYQAVVSDISDATTDSSGNVTYEVTAIIEGNTEGLFQGMTGDITFITKEVKEVTYVSNRAIVREGKSSYVKVKDENGKIRSVEVTTGFSDGVNVEIIDGLNVGDVVLIESKVGES